MSRQEELTPIEKTWGDKLQAYSIGHCLEASELLDLAEENAPSAFSGNSQQYMQHILFCPVCQARLIELRRLSQMRPPRFSIAALTASLSGLRHARKQQPDVGQQIPNTDAVSRPASPPLQGRFANATPVPTNVPPPLQGRFANATPVPTNVPPPTLPVPLRTHRSSQVWMRGVTITGFAALLIIGIIAITTQRNNQTNNLQNGGNNGYSPVPNDDHQNLGNQNQHGTTGTGDLSGQRLELNPVGTINVNTSLKLSWIALSEAKRYTVELVQDPVANIGVGYDKDFHYDPPVDGTTCSIPSGTMEAGKTYKWTVIAYSGDTRIASSSSLLRP